jgi:hypothetical protein
MPQIMYLMFSLVAGTQYLSSVRGNGGDEVGRIWWPIVGSNTADISAMEMIVQILSHGCVPGCVLRLKMLVLKIYLN